MTYKAGQQVYNQIKSQHTPWTLNVALPTGHVQTRQQQTQLALAISFDEETPIAPNSTVLVSVLKFSIQISDAASTHLPEEEELSRIGGEDGDLLRTVPLQHEVATQTHDQLCLMLVFMTVVVIRLLPMGKESGCVLHVKALRVVTTPRKRRSRRLCRGSKRSVVRTRNVYHSSL